jgi:hypothetical protein
MKKLLKFIALAAFVSLSINAWAGGKMKEPTVEYSADMIMQSERGSIKSKIYHAMGGKGRQEMSARGSTQIVITRGDKKVAWALMPDQKSYIETSIDESKQKSGTNVSDCDMDITPLGTETVNGVKATKNKVSMSCPDKANYNGHMWITKEGIMVKLDAVAGQGSNQTHLKVDLMNLKIGKQDPSLFEIPAGYQKFSMGNLSSLFQSSKEPKEEDQGEGEEAEGDDEGIMGTVNKLKGLFGK